MIKGMIGCNLIWDLGTMSEDIEKNLANNCLMIHQVKSRGLSKGRIPHHILLILALAVVE